MCIFPCCNNNNVKYGPFCNKHKRNYLVNNNIQLSYSQLESFSFIDNIKTKVRW